MSEWLKVFFNKYLVIFTVSYKILCFPHSYGKQILDDPNSTQTSLLYATEMLVLVITVFSISHNVSLPSFLPIELLALAYCLYILVYSSLFLVFLRFFSRGVILYKKSLAAFNYAAGIVLPIFILAPIIDRTEPHVVLEIFATIIMAYVTYIYTISCLLWLRTINKCSGFAIFAASIVWYITFLFLATVMLPHK
ncbi:hypothetical protein RS130_22065 [Paraglaciecola aquimarina]|uniref:Yip1 domain-containing protein n=1 Tax=Paraglaciecola aquimarina TaxID=1235557 RepID=A0ABU3T1R5_9ALTE|nr:hypothetical protein [Paraglaciecola aquimarina]MDU0356209.1 hypothetical protein [Paraglaciecola aquimarina]